MDLTPVLTEQLILYLSTINSHRNYLSKSTFKTTYLSESKSTNQHFNFYITEKCKTEVITLHEP